MRRRGVAVLAFFALAACGPDQPSAPPETPRVLMLVANEGFFFQEYFDPRLSLEEDDIDVDVVSVDGGTAIPHAGSYDGRFTGISPTIQNLTGTLAVADVNADDYDALVIVGGWGA